MPDRTGRFTQQEQTFIEALAATGDKGFAAYKADYRSTKSLQKTEDPRIMVAVERWRRDNLVEIVGEAGKLHLAMLRDDRVPAASRVALIKLAYDQWSSLTQQGAEGKQPHEMTADELAAEIARREANLRQVEAAAAAKAIDVTPAEAPSIFD